MRTPTLVAGGQVKVSRKVPWIDDLKKMIS